MNSLKSLLDTLLAIVSVRAMAPVEVHDTLDKMVETTRAELTKFVDAEKFKARVEGYDEGWNEYDEDDEDDDI